MLLKDKIAIILRTCVVDNAIHVQVLKSVFVGVRIRRNNDTDRGKDPVKAV